MLTNQNFGPVRQDDVFYVDFALDDVDGTPLLLSEIGGALVKFRMSDRPSGFGVRADVLATLSEGAAGQAVARVLIPTEEAGFFYYELWMTLGADISTLATGIFSVEKKITQYLFVPTPPTPVEGDEPNQGWGFHALENLDVSDPFEVYYNIAIGYYALYNAITSFTNIAIGGEALYSLTTGYGNIAIGSGALASGTTAFENIAIGDASMEMATTAQANIGVGRHTLEDLTTGTFNIAIGDEACRTSPVTGSGNTVIGRAARPGTAASTDRIVIGRGVTGVADNAITLGDSTRAITCNFDTDQTWDAPSDLRMKDVQGESALGLDFVLQLRPIEYTHKPVAEWPAEWGFEPDDEVDTSTVILGLGAQDVRAALDSVGSPAFHGWSVNEATGQQMLGESAFVYPLINAVRELTAQVEELRAEIKALTNG
jgi:hypothetical protein